jgi:Uma2 family endonuclease
MAIGQPVWAIAERFPRQGEWTEAQYFALPEGFPRVELSDGRLEVLPMPTDRHQTLLTAMLELLIAFVGKHGGKALPIRVRIGEGRVREPDCAYLLKANLHLRGDVWSGADLVVEVVSGGAEDRVRDYVTKRREYAEARIPEYWIVDPEEERITVLLLQDGAYVIHGVFDRGATATSAVLEGFAASVDAILDAD